MKWLYRLLFLVNVYIILFRSGFNQIGGDEVAAYISLVPFFHSLQHGTFFPGFLVFFHEPLFQVIQLPVLFFGATQFFVRIPNVLAAMGLFIVLYKVGKLLFGKKELYIVLLLLLYIVNGYFKVYRAELNHSYFNLGLLTALYFILQQKFYTAYTFLLITCFVYIDAAFTIPGFFLYYLGSLKNWRRVFEFGIVIPSLVATGLVILWAGSVFLGSIVSHAYSWQGQAPFSLLARGTAYSLSAVSDNTYLFLSNNSAEYIIFLVGFLAISFFDKRSKPIWALIALPLLYFNLVKMPTVHVLNFFTLMLVLAIIGVRFFIEEFPKLKIFVLIAAVIVLTKSITDITWYNPFNYDSNFKKAASYIRTHSEMCKKIYTNLDGYTFRFYFNRPYTSTITNDVEIAVIINHVQPTFVKLKGFGEIARVEEFNKSTLHIYKRGYSGAFEAVDQFDKPLFSYSNTLTFITRCRK